MAFLDKLMFWKKKDDLGPDIGNFGADGSLGTGPNMGLNAADPGMGGQNAGLPNQDLSLPKLEPQFGQQMPASQFGQAPQNFPGAAGPPGFQQATPMMPQQPAPNTMVGKDIEVVSAKLDSLRATLDAINQRLANIERIAMHDQEKRKGW